MVKFMIMVMMLQPLLMVTMTKTETVRVVEGRFLGLMLGTLLSFGGMRKTIENFSQNGQILE